GSSRFPEFPNLIDDAVKNLKKHKIDCVCAIGGNGTFKGAKLLNKYIKTFFFPATIDNDVWFSTYCLGYGSALQEIVNSAKKLEATFKTHKNIIFLELMGRYCNDLLINSNNAMGLNLMISNVKKLTKFEIKELIQKFYKKYNYVLVFVIEKLYSNDEINEITKYLESEFNTNVRYQVLGYTQRGADVVFSDLLFSSQLSNKFFNILNNNCGGALFKKNDLIEFEEYGKINDESKK
ncbi:MAG: 6-phosphofructokinase, partial [Ureaplasma sp.]|nr:6-phosphofructokinase [Ureaplasma sp.]